MALLCWWHSADLCVLKCAGQASFESQWFLLWASLVAQMAQNLPANAGDLGLTPGSGRSPGGEMAIQSSILVWRTWWTEEPGGLLSVDRLFHRWPDQSALVLSGGYVFKCLLDNTLRGPHPLPKWAFLQNPRALLKLGHWLARRRSSLRPQWQLLNLLLVAVSVCEARIWMSSFLLWHPFPLKELPAMMHCSLFRSKDSASSWSSWRTVSFLRIGLWKFVKIWWKGTLPSQGEFCF